MNPNPKVWNDFYKSKKILKYPDENVIRIVESLSLPVKSFVLDFGCGSGRHIQFFLDKGFSNLYGMDFSIEAIQICKTLYPQVNFLLFESLPLSFQNDFFDLILCWGVLHYNDSEMRKFLLKEFYRILKPQAFFVGTYRSKEDTHFASSEMKNSNIFYFDKEEVQRELENYFSNIQLGYSVRTPLGKLDQKIAHYFFICQKF
ncbi:MAG: class I SAM-dependent methyltransferase [Leptonema sp. (in: bacteria)]